MKYILAAAAASLLLASCASNPANKCISKSEAGGQPVDFGSAEASAAYNAIPSFFRKRDSEDKAAAIIAKIDDALNTYVLSPEGETRFIRKRLGVNRQLQNTAEVKKDTERLIALDRLHANEGPYLLSTLETPDVEANEIYDRQAQPLVRIPPIVPVAAFESGNSGHCVLEFDVSPIGAIENIRVGYCTNDVFRESSVNSLAKWRYNPAIRNGKGVTRKNVETKIRYVIQDACGNTLPE